MTAGLSLARPPAHQLEGGESGLLVGAAIGLSLATAGRTANEGRGVGGTGSGEWQRTASMGLYAPRFPRWDAVSD